MITTLLAICLTLAPSNPLAATVDQLAQRKGLDTRLVLAVIEQESSGRMISTSKHGQLFDMGLGQIHRTTAKAYKFDESRLVFDEAYNLQATIQVLADKVVMCRAKVGSFACYHDSRESKRIDYLFRVLKHLKP